MLKALLLIGGKSTRMGEDKYLLNIHGRPQYEHLYRLIGGIRIPVYLSCTLEQSEKIPKEFNRIHDDLDNLGPLGGLSSAMRYDPTASWLVVACDLVGLTQGPIRKLVESHNVEFDVTTYRKADSNYFETTLTIYTPSCSTAVFQQIKTGDYSLQKLIKRLKTKTIVVEKDDFLLNANSRADLPK
jgi:molybdopterin-guanine dinucleotide biosynthesis protein A